MKQTNNQTHDFSNTVVAILESTSQVGAALDSLAAAGFEAEMLKGEAGRSHLDGGAESGIVGAVRRMAQALGDETRIMRHLDTALADGRTVISVDVVDSDQAPLAAAILEEHDGKYMWRFGEWSFNRIGAGDDEEDEDGDDEEPRPSPTKPGQGSRI
jgi:hypothetical protein